MKIHTTMTKPVTNQKGDRKRSGKCKTRKAHREKKMAKGTIREVKGRQKKSVANTKKKKKTPPKKKK